MKLLSTSIILLISTLSFGQLKTGFNVEEAKFTIAMCNSFNFLQEGGLSKDLVPEEFNLIHTSDIVGMDNKFQVYENGMLGVINYRGSTDKLISWVENCYSAMIPANGIIKIKDEAHNYSFSKNPESAVHAGYALTIVMLSEKIEEQVKVLNSKGIYNIIITGHSQGGALATLTRAYLENLPKGKISSKNNYKTYAYAQPMSGNLEFSEEYNSSFTKNGTSFFIVNPKDPIPYMPFNYEEGKLVTKDKIKGWLFGRSTFSARKLGQDAFIRLFESGLTKYVKKSNSLINKVLALKFGKIEMPEFVADINYFSTGNKKEISSFYYPKVEVDIRGLDEKEMSKLQQGNDGKWYKKETRFFQHKPYSYYVYVLKEWDYDAYRALEKTYLISDL